MVNSISREDWDKRWPNFTINEFRCPCCGLVYIRPKLLDILQEFRDRIGEPVYISSGTRCKAHNKDIGGSSASQHLSGKAADICVRGWSGVRIVQELDEMGGAMGGGIGVYRTYVHIDIRKSKQRWGLSWRHSKYVIL